MSIYEERVRALTALLPEKVDAALVTSQVNLFYFTGFDCDNAWLLADRTGCVYMTDSRYGEAAARTIDFCPVIIYETTAVRELAQIIKDSGTGSVLIERSRMTVADYELYTVAFSPAEVLGDDRLDKAIASLRDVKSPVEHELIRAAQAVTEASYKKLLSLVKEGVSEKELALELEYTMRRNGAEKKAFDLIVAAGANGSMPHAVPSDYRIKQGDMITFDIGAVVGGYHSDMTRTVVLGRPDEQQRDVYETVLRAQTAACDYLLSGGRDRRECDAIARRLIDEKYNGMFGHSLGHGVGLEIHETPNLSPRSNGELVPGNVVTVEPGIYLPGVCGVRIEDMMYITETSAENLTKIEKELVSL